MLPRRLGEGPVPRLFWWDVLRLLAQPPRAQVGVGVLGRECLRPMVSQGGSHCRWVGGRVVML
eukprot:5949911-Pyramimonas_sp.AAC.1